MSLIGRKFTWRSLLTAPKIYANRAKRSHRKEHTSLASILTTDLSRQPLGISSVHKNSLVVPEWRKAFWVASANMIIAIGSLFYTPLLLMMIPGLIYSHIPVYQLAYESIKERRISSYFLDTLLVTGLLMGLFFRIAAFGVWIVILGRILLQKSEDRSKQKLRSLFGEQQHTVWVVLDGIEVEIPFDNLKKGDVCVIGAGQTIPADGTIIEGQAAIDQHQLTGESNPAEKEIGDSVLASTVVLTGKIHVEATKTGTETVAMQIGEILNQTADFKSQIQSRGEAIADQLVVPTIALSLIFWPVLGFHSMLAALTNTFGYKMRLFAPASMLTFLNITSQEGILIKDGRSLDLLKDIDLIIFDKTGTLTLEQPSVNKIHTCADVDESEILRYAAAVEQGQGHPIAKAILAKAHADDLQWPAIDHAAYEIGYGIQAKLPERSVLIGSKRFMTTQNINIPSAMNALQERCHERGKLLVMVAFDEQLVGAIELETTLRPEAKTVIRELRELGMPIYIISGDHEEPTRALAQELALDGYFAQTLPERKASLIQEFQAQGKSVCFVGDGINDTIALKKANVSISLRGATTMATDSAQVVLMKGNLEKLGKLFAIAHDFDANMKKNLLISTIPTIICIGGVLFLQWGVLTGIMITAGTMFAGIGNTVLPLFKNQPWAKRKEIDIK